MRYIALALVLLSLSSSLRAEPDALHPLPCDGAAACRSACEEGDAAACTTLAQMYLIVEVLERPRELLTEACKTGHAPACITLVEKAYAMELEDTPAFVRGVLQPVCEAGSAHACIALIDDLIDDAPEEAERTQSRAFALLDERCETQGGIACFDLAEVASTGVLPLVDAPIGLEGQVHAKAETQLQTECEQGSASACATLLEIYEIGAIELDSDVSDQRFATYSQRAFDLYTKACDAKSAEGCHGLAALLDQGRAPESVTEDAEPIFTKACELGYLWDCAFHPNDLEQITTQLMEPECDAGHKQACLSLMTYLELDGEEADYLKALTQACKLDLAEPCFKLADTLFDTSPKDAFGYLDRACGLGVNEACYEVFAILTEEDGPVPRDVVRAIGALDRACSRNDSDACVELFDIFEEGELVPADAQRAAHYKGRACATGECP